jgi:hypothetical protein
VLREAVDHGYREAGLFSSAAIDYHFISKNKGEDVSARNTTFDHCVVPRFISDIVQTAVFKLTPQLAISALAQIFSPPKLEEKDLEQCVNDSFKRQRFFCNKRNIDTPILQKGVYRVCDFECIDESNTAQYLISILTMRKMMRELEPKIGGTCLAVVENALAGLWIDLGDAVSHHYVGTDSLSTFDINGGVTAQIHKSSIQLERLYFRYFLEAERQDGIQILLGKYIPDIGSKADILQHTEFIRKVYARDLFFAPSLIRYFKFLRQFTSPKNITQPSNAKSTVKFTLATGWLSAYILTRKLASVNNEAIMKLSKAKLQNLPSKPLEKKDTPEETDQKEVLAGCRKRS